MSEFDPPAPVATGRYIAVLSKAARSRAARVAKTFQDGAGLRVASARELGAQATAEIPEGAALYFDRFGIAVVSGGGDDINMLASLQSQSDIVSVRPEFYMYSADTWWTRREQWLMEGLRLVVDANNPANVAPAAAVPALPVAKPSDDFTWGLQAIGADVAGVSGKNVRVAVLDTGLDLLHRDWRGRTVLTQSFVPGVQSVQDGQGHGTHCAGTIGGPRAPSTMPRYGVAPDADMMIGKVLSDSGSGQESWIVAGINWAVENKADIVSMSLGRAVQPGEPYDPTYENIGKIALESGTLIVAAAGNESARKFNYIGPVGAPANSPSFMAVAAIDVDQTIADFSCGAINGSGGEVDIAGPGVDVYSSWPEPRGYRRLQGTSMACPHVAGLAALIAEQTGLRGAELWKELETRAKKINGLTERDVGRGLAHF